MRKFLFKVFFFLFGFKQSHIEKNETGSIVILIDGLSFDALHTAIHKKYTPILKKISKSHSTQEYYCGLPAATTATEALLFYGSKYNIPGFTWYDRTLNQFVRGNRSLELSSFEDLYPKRRELFKDGSVIMAVYSGGASELSISGRNLTLQHPFSIIKKIKYLLIALLYPLQLFRTLFLALKTLILYRRSNRHSSKETFSKIFLGQFSCFLTEIEILRSTKRIFVDFLLYDEYAHEYGPTHPTTLSTLRLIDKYIKRILSTARQSDRKYNFIILSDHGQSESIPSDYPEEKSTSHINDALQSSSYSVIKTYGGYRPKKNEKILYSVPAGSTLQLYFSQSMDGPLTEDKINTQYPNFLNRLLSYPEFGWLLVRKNDTASILYGKSGSIQFDTGGAYNIIGNPFPTLQTQEKDRTILSFQYYSTFPNNGDIVVFGDVNREGKVYSFEKHRGTHGGFYGAMTHPFIMTNNPKIMGKSMDELFDTIAIEI